MRMIIYRKQQVSRLLLLHTFVRIVRYIRLTVDNDNGRDSYHSDIAIKNNINTGNKTNTGIDRKNGPVGQEGIHDNLVMMSCMQY